MAEISTAPITKAQKRAIKIAQRRHGIDDADYRKVLMQRFGVDSCTKLTRRQANQLLSSFGVKLRNPPGARKPRSPRRPPAPERVTAMASRAQRELITDLIGEIAWKREGGYERWLWRSMGLRLVATSEQAGRVIEGLKAMRRRVER